MSSKYPPHCTPSTGHLFPVLQYFEREARNWGHMSVNHPNIVPLLGYVVCKDRIFPGLVAPWYKNGDLWTYLTTGNGSGAKRPERIGYVSGLFQATLDDSASTEYECCTSQFCDVANAMEFCKRLFRMN